MIDHFFLSLIRQINDEFRKYFLSLEKNTRYIFFICLIFSFCYTQWLVEIPVFFPGASAIGSILNVIVLSYVSGYIFYIVSVHIPKVKNYYFRYGTIEFYRRIENIVDKRIYSQLKSDSEDFCISSKILDDEKWILFENELESKKIKWSVQILKMIREIESEFMKVEHFDDDRTSYYVERIQNSILFTLYGYELGCGDYGYYDFPKYEIRPLLKFISKYPNIYYTTQTVESLGLDKPF